MRQDQRHDIVPSTARHGRALSTMPGIGLALVMLTLGQPSLADIATDQRCAKGADVRRIEIRFADDAGGLPCKVVYRPENESDTVGIVSWQDLETPGACEAQATEVIDRLTGEGWTCARDESAVEIAQDDEVVAAQATLEPETTILPVETAATAAPAADGDTGPLAEEIDQPAKLVDNPDVAAPSDDLAALIQSDLDRLDTTLDGLLEARIAGYGDLNDDALDDALVLFTYTSPQPAYRQFLAVYMFDGEAHRLTATRPVGGNVSATKNATVETIDRGVVHLSLQAFEPGDASCCPSGERRLALALRDLDLVEIDADAPTR